MYDAIVVGARCAGAPTALLLARKGYRVLLVDKATFPSEAISTHYIHQAGIARLVRWGLLEKILASNCPPILRYVFDLGPFTLAGSPPAVDGIEAAYAPRRKVLDTILVEAAVEAGVELRESCAVQELVRDDERVTGIRAHTRGGATVTESARIVIGADGRNSFVARTVQAPAYNTHPSFTCSYYAYWRDVSVEALEYYPREGLSIITLPTDDGLTCILVACPSRDFPMFRADLEGNFWRQLDRVPAFAERVRAGRRVERFLGTAALPHFCRKPYGPGWALVGDAGYHKDPQGGEGITDAFRDAELLAAAIDAGFTGRQQLDAALADYERQRNAVALPVCELVCLMACLEPFPAELMALMAALRGNPTETSRFFGTISQAVPVAEFFAPANIQRIIHEAQSPHRAASPRLGT